MRMRVFALSLMAATTLGSAAALAGPTLGTIPLPSYSDGFLDIVFNDHETLVNPKASPPVTVLQGTGIVTSITGGSNTTYGNSKSVTATGTNGIGGTYGPNPKVLTDVFTGFTFRTSIVDPILHTTTIYFTGGQLNLYVSNSSQLVPNTTGVSVATAEFNAGLGNPAFTLWLQLTPEKQDSFGDTFITTINTTTLSNFSLAQGIAYLDATGGLAKSYFDTNSVSNSYLSQFADLQFGGRAGVKCTLNTSTCQLPVGGSDDAFNVFTPVPEPMTLSLFGAGVAGFAAMRRRKAKKA